MYIISRRIPLVIILFALSTMLVPMSARGQGPDPGVGEFLEARIREPTRFMRAYLNVPSVSRPQHNLYFESPASVMATQLFPWSTFAYASYLSGNFDIHSAIWGGNGYIWCTKNPATDTTPELNRGSTQLAFVSRRDGNPEIYTMRVDGTNKVRLTTNEAGDYMPTWAPDSAKIAFYSDQSGDAEIYVMAANGTGLTRLTTNGAWDGHPTWAPSGDQIAFVSNRSGTYELWMMNQDGSNQRQISYGLNTIAFPDWSPDGNHFAFSWDANGDGWFDLAIMDVDGTNVITIFDTVSTADFLAPVWAPNSDVLMFSLVSWIQYYGNWYWRYASLYFYEVSTQQSHYASHDAYSWWPDWQTNDIVAPISQAYAPRFSNSAEFTVEWSGRDNGSSGIHSYDVQYRDDVTGIWTDLVTTTMQTQATFTGDYGHTYYFRSRARDLAGNVEAYPEGDGDTSTHVYRYALSGHVLGNRDQPVVAAMQVTPPALNTTVSDAYGGFEFYFDDAGTYTLTASHPDFGVQPPMKHISVPGTLESPVFYLPPADDVVVDGDFEAGNLAAWMPSGDIMPVITSTAHTGDSAVMLGGAGASTFIAPGGWRSIIEQEVTVSTMLTETTLSLLYRVAEAALSTDRLEVYLVGPTQTLTSTLPLTVSGWAHHWWDLSGWTHPTVTVRIAWYQSEMTRTAGIILDEISLGASIQGAYAVYLPVVFRNN